MKREDLLFIERMSNEWPQDWDGERIRAGLRQVVEANAELLAEPQGVCSDANVVVQSQATGGAA